MAPSPERFLARGVSRGSSFAIFLGLATFVAVGFQGGPRPVGRFFCVLVGVGGLVISGGEVEVGVGQVC